MNAKEFLNRFSNSINVRNFLVAYGASLVFFYCLNYISFNDNYSALHIEFSHRSLAEIEPPRHKDLFPLDASDWWGFILVGLGLLVAASGGVGGGGIIVPLLILVFGFPPKYAIPLSNFTILGSSITNMWMNLSKRHPDANRPLVDWDLILVMEPLTMTGAIVGAFLSKVLPDWILVISLVILLAFTTKTTLEKGISQWKKETKYFEELKRSELSRASEIEMTEGENQALLGEEPEKDSTTETDSPKQSASSSSSTPYSDPNPELTALLKSEEDTPFDKVAVMSMMVLVVIVLNLVKGGSGSFKSPLGIQCGSASYWGVTALVFAVVLAVSMWCRNVLIEKYYLKKRLNFVYQPGDIEWNESNTLKYPSVCFFAGFFAGLFGIGGGIVKGPLMLHMGVHPLVAAGTVAVMIMFTSVAATAMFVAFGTLTWDYAVFLFVWGLVTTIVGQFGVSYLVEKYKRVSLVSLSIGAVVALSTILMAIQGVFSLVDAQEGKAPSSSSLCGK